MESYSLNAEDEMAASPVIHYQLRPPPRFAPKQKAPEELVLLRGLRGSNEGASSIIGLRQIVDAVGLTASALGGADGDIFPR